MNWSDDTRESAPTASTEISPVPGARGGQVEVTPSANINQRFPIEKLASPRPSPSRASAIPPTPPPETDDMDWTPSVQQEIRPTVSVYQRNQPSALDGPLPFYGNLPAAPKPPAWNLRMQQPSTKPIEQVVERNPFHRNPAQPQTQWQRKAGSTEPVFKPPKFFPMSDHDTSTGLETLFDRAFTIQTSGDPRRDSWTRRAPHHSSLCPADAQNYLIFQYMRLALLMGCIAAWILSQNRQLSIPGNYIEVGALGSASLIAGFALLEAAKRPLAEWNGMEILVYITELGAAVHLGAHLPDVFLEREYFDRYGKLLLIFMAVQEALGLVSFYRAVSDSSGTEDQQPAESVLPQQESPQQGSPNRGAIAWSPTEAMISSPPGPRSFTSQSSAPPLSFASTAGVSSFSTALPPAPQYRLSSSQTFHSFPNSFPTAQNKNTHSFTMKSLKEADPPSDYDQDSDTDTVATTATTLTDATTRNIRYGRNNSDHIFSPKRSELGPGLGGLSLDDGPAPRRVTRSQTQQGLVGRRNRAVR